MVRGRWIFAVLALALVGSGAAQPSTVDELALALRTDAMVLEEPLGIVVDCAPYADVFPGMDLSCFGLSMPAIVMRGRFGAYVGEQPSFSWAGDWEPIPDLPAHVDPEDRHIRRELAAASGRTFVIAIFDAGMNNHIVVASEAD